MRGAVVGLLAMMAGCLLFIPASASTTFGVFLAALFVLASGVTIVQVVANPMISLLGSPATAGSRQTFAQAFNARGTTIFPLSARSSFSAVRHKSTRAGSAASRSTLTGMLADVSASLSVTMILPMICYAVMCAYGLSARKPLTG